MPLDDHNIEEANLVRMASLGGTACCAVMLLLIASLAIAGAILAAKSRQDYPADDATRAYAVKTFSSLVSWHNGLATVMLVPTLFLMAFAIIFALHVGGLEAKHTSFAWAQPIRAGVLLLLVLAGTIMGKMYMGNLVELNFWLMSPPGGFPEGTVVAKGQVVGAGSFSTFIVFHAVLLPLVAIAVIIWMWPAFHEFIGESRKKTLGPQLKFTHGQDLKL